MKYARAYCKDSSGTARGRYARTYVRINKQFAAVSYGGGPTRPSSLSCHAWAVRTVKPRARQPYTALVRTLNTFVSIPILRAVRALLLGTRYYYRGRVVAFVNLLKNGLFLRSRRSHPADGRARCRCIVYRCIQGGGVLRGANRSAPVNSLLTNGSKQLGFGRVTDKSINLNHLCLINVRYPVPYYDRVHFFDTTQILFFNTSPYGFPYFYSVQQPVLVVVVMV